MRGYLRNAGWIFVEKIVRVVITFILFALISRQLGPEDTGILSFSQSIVTMLLCITGLGLDSILIKEFATNRVNENKIYSTVMISKIAVSLLVMAFCGGIIFFIDISELSKIVFIISLASLVFQSQTTFYSYFQANSKSSVVTKYSFIALLLSSLLKVYFLVIKSDVIWFALSYSLDVIISCIVLEYQMKRLGIKIEFSNFEPEVIISLLRQSYPIILSSLIIILYTRLDQVMIAKMLGAKELGVFSVAIRISDAYSFIPVAVATSFFPLLASNNQRENVRLYFDLVYFSAFASAMLVIAFSFIFFESLFGSAYDGALPVLCITVFSTVFAVLGGACTNYLVTINLTYMRLVRAVLGLLINFILNIIWIPKYGLLGAAFASLISQVFSSYIGNVLNKRTWECFRIQTLSIITFGFFGVKSIAVKIFRRKYAEKI